MAHVHNYFAEWHMRAFMLFAFDLPRGILQNGQDTLTEFISEVIAKSLHDNIRWVMPA